MAEDRQFTRCEKRIFEVLTNPEYYNWTTTCKIEKTGVSRAQFYIIMGDEWFRKQVKNFFLQQVATDIGPVIDSALQTSKIVGKDGHADRKMLLEMAGQYEPPRQNVDHTTNGKDLPVAIIEIVKSDGEPI